MNRVPSQTSGRHVLVSLGVLFMMVATAFALFGAADAAEGGDFHSGRGNVELTTRPASLRALCFDEMAQVRGNGDCEAPTCAEMDNPCNAGNGGCHYSVILIPYETFWYSRELIGTHENCGGENASGIKKCNVIDQYCLKDTKYHSQADCLLYQGSYGTRDVTKKKTDCYTISCD